jgi:hypothetical protein
MSKIVHVTEENGRTHFFKSDRVVEVRNATEPNPSGGIKIVPNMSEIQLIVGPTIVVAGSPEDVSKQLLKK